jgi:hypothetical protein
MRVADLSETTFMRLSTILAVLGFVCAWLAPAGHSSADSDADVRMIAWRGVIDRFSAVLAGESSNDALKDLAIKAAWIQTFEQAKTEPIEQIQMRLPRAVVISRRAYFNPAVSAASDLVSDLAGVNLPGDLLKQFLSEDELKARSADATFAKWFALVLDAQIDEPVGYVVLYDDGAADVEAGVSARPATIWFVLIKGTTDASGQPVIGRAVYGTIDEATR